MNTPVPPDPTSAVRSVSKAKPSVGWLVFALFLIPAIIFIAKQPGSPISAWMVHAFSCDDLAKGLRSELRLSVFIPLAALIVVFFRVALGLRVLGPFRSILLAMAFKVTGGLYGVLYLGVAVGLFVSLRPVIKRLRLPYFGRSTLMLCCVSFLMSAGALLSKWTGVDAFALIVYFPIVVLSLVADAFARAATKDGLPSAIWRCVTTATLAVALAWLMNQGPLRLFLLRYPELILAEMGGIIVICRWCGWRLLNRYFPRI